jgi:hypothetical protein
LKPILMFAHRPCISFALVAGALLICRDHIAQAVIVAGDYATTSDASVNTTPPGDDPGFYNVGSYGHASAIYLGNNWVLTASHIQGSTTTFTFPDPNNARRLVTATYEGTANSGVVLKNTVGPQAGTASDVYVYRIDPATSTFGAPNLPRLTIAPSSPATGAKVIGIGRGIGRAASQSYWDNSSPTWQTTTHALARHTGYITAGPQVMRWGENLVTAVNQTFNVGSSSNPRYSRAFTTQFDQNEPTQGTALPNEFQGTYGDSGGAVFEKVGSAWLLAGMIESVMPLAGQPYPNGHRQFTAAFGESTIAVDLSCYRSQIVALDPVPGDANGDGIVNGHDTKVVESHWLTAGPAGDVNGDGLVNGLDINFVASHWPAMSKAGAGIESGAAAGTPAITAMPVIAVSVLCALGTLCLCSVWWIWRIRSIRNGTDA